MALDSEATGHRTFFKRLFMSKYKAPPLHGWNLEARGWEHGLEAIGEIGSEVQSRGYRVRMVEERCVVYHV